MDAFIMIRRKNQTICIVAKDNMQLEELKKIISSIIDVQPHDQQLYYNDQILDETKTLSDYGLSSSIAKAQNPAVISLALRLDDGEFEPLEIIPYTLPPELPYVRSYEEMNDEDSE